MDASGRVYVADTGNGRVQEFTGTGVFLAQFGSYGTGNGQIGEAEDVAVDTHGSVYVTDYAATDTLVSRVDEFAIDGTFLTMWGSSGTGDGQLQIPWGIAVDAGDNV